MRTRVLGRSLFILLVVLAAPLHAQWRLVTKLPSIGSTVYFLDKLGARNIGFVGCQGHIVRTSDGGKTWTTVYSAGGNIDLRDFVFKDLQNGIAVGSRLFSYLTTTDGGLTWQMTGQTYSATSVTYIPNSKELTMNTVSQFPAFASTDWGQNWTQIVVPPGQNGMAFGDSLIGIFSAHASGAPLYRTTDGARTWKGTNFYEHIYSPIALDPLAGVYVGAAELRSELWISRDSGETWTLRSNMKPIVPTGCLRYYHGHLWCQSGSNGMFVSDDTGLTWTSLCGPSRNIDSRFYNVDSTLIAADNQANLWMMDDATQGPGASFISFRQVPVTMSSPQCGLVDKRIDLIMNVCFDVLDSAYLTGSPRIQFIYPPLPAPLTNGSGVVVRYTPDSVHMYDTAYLHLAWGSPGRKLRDTVIKILVNVGGTGASVKLNDLVSQLATTCRTLDTMIEIKSLSCNLQELIGVSLDDSSVFHLGPISLPDTLNVHGSAFLHVFANATDTGTFSATMHIKLRNPNGVIDTSILLKIDVHSVELPTAARLKIVMKDLCDWQDTILWLHNRSCRSIVLEDVRSSDTNLTIFDTLLPIQIAAQDSIPIRIRLEPGGAQTLHLIYVSVREGSLLFDTSFVVLGQTLSNTVPNPRITSSPLRFGLTSSCAEKRLPMLLFNDKCGDVKLLAVKWDIADPQFSFDPLSLPRVLSPTATDSIVFHYKPAQLKQSTATVTLTFELSGERRDTTIFITGIGTDTESAVLNNEILNYPTISKCEFALETVMFENVSCDTMVIASFYDWQNNGYTVLSPKVPLFVPPGDSVAIVVRLARNSDGTAADSIEIEYGSSKPPRTPLHLRLKLNGNIQTTIAPPFLSGLGFESVHLPPCAEYDSFFVITNKNDCDTLSLLSTQGSTGVTSSTKLPLMLLPGKSDTVRFHYTPQSDTASGTLAIKGTDLDTTLQISTLRAHSQALTCSPSFLPAFIAPMCHVASDTLTLSAYGCDSAILDRIEILPTGSNYYLEQSYSLPRSLNGKMIVSVKYDPSFTGSDTASLYLHSRDGKLDLRIPLAGFTTKLQIAQLAIRNDTATQITNVGAGKSTNVSVITLDAIDDSLALQNIDLSLALNENILTLAKITPGQHFSNTTSSQQQQSLSFSLQKTDHASIAPNSLLATLAFTTYVSDTIVTDVSIQSIAFNAQDKTYEDCVLRPVTEPEALTVKIDPSCNRDFLVNEMSGLGILTSIRARPTVLNNNDQLTLDLDASKATTVNVRLVNVLGKEIAHEDLSIEMGRSSFAMPLKNISSGPAFIHVSCEGTSSTILVIVIR